MYQLDCSYLRPRKGEKLKKMYQASFVEKQELQVWQGNNATILPLRKTAEDGILFGRGGVVDQNGEYVELSGIPDRVGKPYPFENPEYRDESVVYCGYLINHWGHFLMEAVTRLWYFLEDSIPPVDKFVFFVRENETPTVKGNFLEFLKLLGIWDKLEIISVPTTYRSVIVPEIALQCSTFYSPKLLKVFDTVARNVSVDPQWEAADKIFFTRSRYGKAATAEFGGECLDDFFRRNGFLVVAPETVSLSQLIFYMRSAMEVATYSGSVHHNLLFANQGQQVTILERFIWNVDYQVDINRMREFRVTPIDVNFPIYSVDLLGPVILGYNHILERYISDRGLLPPSSVYCTKEYRDKCFRHYMSCYQDNYRFRWHMEFYYPEIPEAAYEAYLDSYPYFKEYLDGNRPFLKEHYFQIHYWKQLLKRLIHYHP